MEITREEKEFIVDCIKEVNNFYTKSKPKYVSKNVWKMVDGNCNIHLCIKFENKFEKTFCTGLKFDGMVANPNYTIKELGIKEGDY